MSENKTFFSSLEPKSAMLVGLVTGFLTLCTIGFFVLGIMMLRGNVGVGSNAQALSYTPSTPSGVVDSGAGVQTPPPMVPKSDKPNVELFVMSHCPYGVQNQRALIPAWELLDKKANIDVKFVSYLMHDAIEKDDNTIEYCIQKEQKDKYIPFLKCFTANGDSKSCLTQVGVNQSKLNSCINSADKQFAINAEFNNQANWLSGQFPLYNVHKDLNEKYGVQGSPTLVINGTVVEVARNPESLKQAICAAFNNPPKECDQTLSTASPAPGFGTQVGAAAPTGGAGCGV